MQPEKPAGAADSDEALCEKGRAGDDEALSILLKRYSREIFDKAGSLYCHRQERDDLYQEGMIALLRAALTFDADRGASFRTYALTCVGNRFRDLGRSHPQRLRIWEERECRIAHLALRRLPYRKGRYVIRACKGPQFLLYRLFPGILKLFKHCILRK